MTAEEFSLTPSQREDLTQVIIRVIPPELQDDWSKLGDFELLMTGLMAAYEDGLSPEQTMEWLRDQLGISREAAMCALGTLAVNAIEVQQKMIQRN
jgi:hypothetical protein